MKPLGRIGLAVFAVAGLLAFVADSYGHDFKCAACQARLERARLMGSAQKVERLPQGVTARRYEVTWKLDVEKFRFDGEVTMQVALEQATDKIVMHALDLEINRVECWRIMPKKGAIDRPGVDDLVLLPAVSLDKKNETVTFKFAEKLSRGDWALKITFAGDIATGNRLSGIYRSSYKDADGQEKFMITTHMEPWDARRALPCFDEPHHRAGFKVTLIVPSSWKGGSNGELLRSKKLDGGKQLLEFADTPAMSTYLLAFTVGELEHTEEVESNGVKIRVWTTRGKVGQAKVALKAAADSIAYYEKVLGIKYQCPRMELIAVPKFPMGAMENWGWIIFLEKYLLVDELKGSESDKLNVVLTVTHEIAHQWFGNLVTALWWDSLWVNEGFATLGERLCADSISPGLRPLQEFRSYKEGALKADTKASARAVESLVETREQSEAVFDEMSYTKAGSLLWMLKEYVGEERFWRGAGRFLARNAFKNAKRSEFFAALDEVIAEDANGRDEPVGSYMDDWFTKPNYPLLAVRLEKGKLVISQQALQKENAGRLWKVPVFIKAKVGNKIIEKIALLKDKETSFDWQDPVEWVLLEPGKGFYRVSYSDNLLDEIGKNQTQLTHTQRFGLVADAWALCQANGSAAAAKGYHRIARDFGQKGVNPEIAAVISESLKDLQKLLPERPDVQSLAKELLPEAGKK